MRDKFNRFTDKDSLKNAIEVEDLILKSQSNTGKQDLLNKSNTQHRPNKGYKKG